MKTKMLFRLVLLLLLTAPQGFAQSLQAETKLSTVTHPTLGDYLTDGDGKTLNISSLTFFKRSLFNLALESARL